MFMHHCLMWYQWDSCQEKSKKMYQVGFQHKNDLAKNSSVSLCKSLAFMKLQNFLSSFSKLTSVWGPVPKILWSIRPAVLLAKVKFYHFIRMFPSSKGWRQILVKQHFKEFVLCIPVNYDSIIPFPKHFLQFQGPKKCDNKNIFQKHVWADSTSTFFALGELANELGLVRPGLDRQAILRRGLPKSQKGWRCVRVYTAFMDL